MDDDADLEKTIIDTSPFVQKISKSHPLPAQIGPYRVKGLLKKGSSSILYLGVSPGSDELIALKVLSPKFVKHPEMIDQFLKEARIIEMADHPNIVKLYGHGKWEGGLYIAMEFVQGISLRKLILQNGLSFKRSLEIILETAQALNHLHAHGIIHRDLKPDNILLSEEGGVKVIDFGIAQILGEELKEQTKKIMGTPTYMSPEQKQHRLEISFPTYIYSLAIIAYELCMGKLCYGVLQLSELPKGLRKILSKALMPDPKDRHASIQEFIEDISEYEDNLEENEELLDLSLRELSDFYENVYLTLSPTHKTFNHKLLIGKASPKGFLTNHIYTDYIALGDENVALIKGWPELKGVGGMFHNAILKGMVQILKEKLNGLRERPVEKVQLFLKTLREQIRQNGLNPFSFVILVLSSSVDQLHYFSCGPNKLWIQRVGANSVQRLKSENEHLGPSENDFHPISTNWNVGDTLYLLSSFSEGEFEEKSYVEAIEKSYLSTGQHQAQAILDELVGMKRLEPQSLSFMITTLQRKR